MISFKNKGSMTVLLAAVLMFSQCKKDDQAYMPETTTETEGVSAKLISATSATTAVPQPFSVATATSDGGYAYRIRNVQFGVAGDSETSTSPVRIFENGVELGPAHSIHADIRSYGKGRFSHKGENLYFSASDNSNPVTNGRKYTFVTTAGALSTTSTTTSTTTTTATSTTDRLALSNLVGYANVNGKTTGGLGGQTVTVTSLSALKSAVESSSTMIVKVSGTIKGSGYVNVKSNKTILGVNGGTVEGISFHIMNVSNVIVQNLTMRYVVGDDCLNIKNSHHIWIDHNDLYNNRNTSDWDYYDGLVDITRQSNYVTLSWNKIHDTYKAVLIGSDDALTSDVGYLKVTLYKNYFYNISERQPCTRFGYMHSFNNYHKNSNGYAVGSTMGATVRTDNNYYDGIKVPIRTDFNSKPGYISGANTNKFVGGGANRITTSASSWTPASLYSYSSAVIPVDQVPSVVMAGAGPR